LFSKDRISKFKFEFLKSGTDYISRKALLIAYRLEEGSNSNKAYYMSGITVRMSESR